MPARSPTISTTGLPLNMDGRARFLHTIVVEHLWRLLMYDCVHLHAWSGGREGKARLGQWIDGRYGGDVSLNPDYP